MSMMTVGMIAQPDEILLLLIKEPIGSLRVEIYMYRTYDIVVLK